MRRSEVMYIPYNMTAVFSKNVQAHDDSGNSTVPSQRREIFATLLGHFTRAGLKISQLSRKTLNDQIQLLSSAFPFSNGKSNYDYYTHSLMFVLEKLLCTFVFQFVAYV